MKIKIDLLIYIAAVFAAVGIFVASPVEVSAADDWQLAGNVRDSYFLNIDFTELSSDRVFYSNYYHFSFDLTSFENPNNSYLQNNAVFFYFVKRSPVYIDRTYDYSLHLCAAYTKDGTDAHIGNFYYSLDQSINGKFLSTSIRWPSASSTRPYFIKDVPALSDSSSGVKSVTVDTDLPIFENNQAAKAYIETGDMSGCINPETLRDLDYDAAVYDDSFLLDDFSASLYSDILTVSWNGIICSNMNIVNYNNNFVHVELFYKVADLFLDDGLDPDDTVHMLTSDVPLSDGGFSLSILDNLPDDSLYFSGIRCIPYYYEDDNLSGLLHHGAASYKNWSQDKKVISGGTDTSGSGNYGSVILQNFGFVGLDTTFLLTGNPYITWDSVSPIPDDVKNSDTFILVNINVYDNDFEISGNYESKLVPVQDYLGLDFRFDDKVLTVNLSSIVRLCEKYNWIWDNEIWLTPCYIKGSVCYQGKSVVLDTYDKTMTEVFDNGDGTLENNDITPEDGMFDLFPDLSGDNVENIGDSMTDYFRAAFSFFKSSISVMGSFPAMLSSVLGFLPAIYLNVLGIFLVVVVILRILGR